MYGTCNIAIVSNILLSNVPPEISFIKAAPSDIVSLATVLLKVSTEIKVFGNSLRIAFMAELFFSILHLQKYDQRQV